MAYGSSNNTSFEAQKWTNLRAFTISDATGNNTGISTDVDGTASVTLYLPSDIEANALTATTWETPRLLTIGATGKNVDGSADISWSMDEIMGQSDSTCFYRGDKTWSSTLTGTLYLTNTTDAAGNAANSPALIIGTATGQHLEFDPDEIMAKATGTTTGTLYINNNGGVTHFGGQLEVQAEATDAVGAIHVIDTRTDANWHYPFLGTCANLVSNGNMYLCVGKTVNPGDAGGLRYQWAATSSIDNLLGLHFSGVGTQLWCYADGSGGVVKEWTIGSRVTTTAPSALTSIDRIIITPYYRTDGPWFIKSEDDSTDAYLSLYYNSAKLIYTKHNGQTTINAPCSDTDYILQLNTTTTGTYRRGFGIFGTALTQGHSILFTIGKANSNKNLGYVGYYHDADAGTANRLIFGLHGVDNVINITGAGYVPIGDTIQFSNTTSWKKGTLIVGANSTDKVVIGYLNSSTNGATVGAHTSACTAWAPLYVAGTEIYIRGQEVTWAKWINGYLSLFPATTGSYREGIRLHVASNGWGHITFCGTDNTGDTGTSANSWLFGTNGGNMYLTRNGSNDDGSAYLRCINNVWAWNGTATGHISGGAGYLRDKTNSTATYLNYGASGLANSAITWLCCWNGYEVRAISKAEMANAVDASHKWIRIGGDTMTGVLTTSYKSGTWVNSLTSSAITLTDTASSYGGWICGPTKNGRIAISTYQSNDDLLYIGYGERGRTTNSFVRSMTWNGANGRLTTASVANAIWNDYAEYRIANTIEPGYCVTENYNGCMIKTTERLMPGCKLISDTYGHIMGETTEAQTPIAVAGRVLAYPYRSRTEYPLGAAVCSAPNGTIDIMTRDEIMMYPERIVGTVSEIPTYDVWYGGDKEAPIEIQVNGRIWIYVR